MQKNTLLTMIIGVTVAVIMAAAVLVPVLNDEMNHDVTFKTDSFRVAMAAAGDDVDVTITCDSPGYFSINGGDSVTLHATYSYIFDDSSYYLRCTGGYNGNSGDVWHITRGHISYTVNGTTYDADTDGDVYYCDPDGDYIMTSSSEYVLTDTRCLVTGMSYIDNGNKVCKFEGSIADGFTLTYSTGTGDVTYSGTPIVEKVDGYENLFILSGVEFTDSNGSTITYNRFVCPASVTATAEHNENVDSLLSVIPLLVITAVLVGVVAAAVRRNEE